MARRGLRARPHRRPFPVPKDTRTLLGEQDVPGAGSTACLVRDSRAGAPSSLTRDLVSPPWANYAFYDTLVQAERAP